MEVDEGQSEEAIFEGMIAAAMKYATDHDLHEDDEAEPANNP